MDFNELKNGFLAKLGKATDDAKVVADKASVGVKEAAGKAAAGVKTGGRIAKLKMDIASEKETVKKAYTEIGKLYYEQHKDDADGLFEQLCGEVGVALQKIEEMEGEIAKLKEGCGDKEDEPDVEVEFEEIVADDEAAAEVKETVEAAAEEAVEQAEAVAEEVADKAEDAFEAVVEKAEEVVEDIKSEE